MRCLKCKKNTNDVNIEEVRTKNNRMMRKAKCAECNTTKCCFISSKKVNDDVKIDIVEIKPEKIKKTKNKKDIVKV